MTKKTHRHQAALGRVAPLTGQLGAGGFTVVGNNKVLSVPAKSANALKTAGAQAMRNLRVKEIA